MGEVVSSLQKMVEQLVGPEEVQECCPLTDDADFLPKVATRDWDSYTECAYFKLSCIPGIQNIKTSFVLDIVKCTASLKLVV